MSLWDQVTHLHLIGVMVAAGMGAVCRGGLDRIVLARAGATRLPWATLAVNVIGSLVLGLVLGWSAGLAERAAVAPQTLDRATVAELVVGIGFAGGLTTFSTFAWEAFRLVGEGRTRAMVAYAGLTVVLTLVAVWFGVVSGRALS